MNRGWPKGVVRVRKAFNIVTTSLLVLVAVLAIALVGVRLFGIAPYTVLSGSMEPNYHVGSLIYVKPVDTNTLQVGDPITYIIAGDTVVTHRIVEIIPDYGEDGSPGFKTKGDANQVEDGTPVHARNVLGKPIFTIPLLGYVAYFIQHPPGSYLAIGFCAVVALLTFMPELVDKLFEEPVSEQGKGELPPTDDIAAELDALRRSLSAGETAEGTPPMGENEHPPNSEAGEAPPDGTADTAL